MVYSKKQMKTITSTKNMHKDMLERLMIIVEGYSKNLSCLIKQKIQLENMYPETPLECWDSHHAEQWLQLCYDIDAVKEFEGTV